MKGTLPEGGPLSVSQDIHSSSCKGFESPNNFRQWILFHLIGPQVGV